METVRRKSINKKKTIQFIEARGGSTRGSWGESPPKTYEGNIFHHNFGQFGKQHSPYKAILSSNFFVAAMLWSISPFHLPTSSPIQ